MIANFSIFVDTDENEMIEFNVTTKKWMHWNFVNKKTKGCP